METAVVVGSSRGIGLAVAKGLLEDGWRVLGSSRAWSSAGSEADNAVSSNLFERVTLDVTDSRSVERFRKDLSARDVRPDLLFCSVGVMRPSAKIVDQSEDSWHQVLDTNLTGVFRIVKALWAELASNPKARIVLVSGLLGNVSSGMRGGGNVAYRVSKAGLAALTMTAAEEGSADGVVACGYDPGWVRTNLGGPDAPKDPSECWPEVKALIEAMLPETSGGLFRGAEFVAW